MRSRDAGVADSLSRSGMQPQCTIGCPSSAEVHTFSGRGLHSVHPRCRPSKDPASLSEGLQSNGGCCACCAGLPLLHDAKHIATPQGCAVAAAATAALSSGHPCAMHRPSTGLCGPIYTTMHWRAFVGTGTSAATGTAASAVKTAPCQRARYGGGEQACVLDVLGPCGKADVVGLVVRVLLRVAG